MKSKWIWFFVVAFAALIWGVGAAGLAADRSFLAMPLNNAISYQGHLTDAADKPLSGTFVMRFQVYDADTGGTALWDSGDMNVAVDKGLFHTALGVDQSTFSGQGLWLSITVQNETLSPRQELLAAGYAMSLKPGAMIDRTTDGDALTVRNVATGFAVRAESPLGSGIYGYSDDNYAVYGFDGGAEQARGYGGYFYSENGVGTYGRSNAESTEQNLWAPGVYGRSTNGVGVYGRTGSTLSYMAAVRGENDGFGFGGYFASENGVPLYILRNTGIGNLFEAWTLNPVNRIFRINTAGHVYTDGSYNTPAADFAELLPAVDGLEAGDVLIIGADGMLTRSDKAYHPHVVGVYSTQPAFLGGVSEDESVSGKIPLAVIGVVPVKASAENGAIQPGDLLVAASLPGHAMRCEGADNCFGRTIGKALEMLDEGTDKIQMLVVLQ